MKTILKSVSAAACAASLAALSLSSCAGPNQTAGTAIGAGAGALAGGIAGNNIRGINKTEGAIAGALVGGLIGNQMGRQQDEINQVRSEVAAQNVQVINVRNSNGSYTPVRLQRVSGETWQGPRGEVYNGLPSERQLRQLYGF